MKILIDAGHNDSKFDTGCEGKKSREQDLTFEISSLLCDMLLKNGHSAHLTRKSKNAVLGSGTVNSSLAKRVEICNALMPDLFLSIHINSGGGVGCEAYVYKMGETAHKYAEKILFEMEKCGRKKRGVKKGNFYVIKNTAVPSILFEVGFIDNEAEEAWLCKNTLTVAKAIFNALCDECEYPNEAEAVAILQKAGIISEAEKWYSGNWNDEDFKWLLKKCALYVDKNLKK